MELAKKFRFAIEKPIVATRFFRSRINELLLLIKRRKVGAIVSFFVFSVTGFSLYDRYINYLVARRDDPFKLVETRDYEMFVDLRDKGLSKELLLYGTREEGPARIFEREVKQIADEVDDPLVVEPGANIGYYTLLMGNLMTETDIDSCDIVAIEPSSKNTALLEQNVRHNGIDDFVSIHQCAISSETGTGTLDLAQESNLHRLAEDGTDVDNAETVPVRRIDDLLVEHDYDPADVNIVRMDIEGQEVAALKGMDEVLSADGPTLLYIEVHNHLFDDSEVRELPDRLSDAGFEIKGVEWGTITDDPFDFSFDIDDWQELQTINSAYGLIAKKS